MDFGREKDVVRALCHVFLPLASRMSEQQLSEQRNKTRDGTFLDFNQ